MDGTEAAGFLKSVVASVETAGDQAVILVRGEVDVHTAPDLHDAVVQCMDAGATSVTFDMDGVEFVGSAGVAVIGLAAGALGGDCVAVRNPPRPVHRVLELTGLADVIHVVVGVSTDGVTG